MTSRSHAALLIGLAATTSLTSACGDNGTGPAPTGLRLVNGNGATDTIQATPAQALVVEVRSETGALASGTVVRFQSLPIDSLLYPTPGVFVSSLTSTYFSTFVADSTNASGRTSVLVQLGTRAGRARLLVSVPEFGLQDTARFTVLSGKLAHVVATPADTALYVGASFQSRATATDRFGNVRTDQITFAPLAAGITISQTGMVTAAGIARASYTASVDCCSDTGWVSVVPQGTLAAFQTTTVEGHGPGVVTFNLDGSGYHWIAAADYANYGVGTAWTPSGTTLAFDAATAPNWMYTSDLSGTVRELVARGDSGLTLVAWPAYSPDGAYVYFSGVTTGNFSLWRADADGSHPHLLYADPSGLAWRESPSPDGTRVVFTTDNPPLIRVYTLASRTLSTWSVPGHTPRWSPAGAMIAFTTQYGGPIHIMSSDGTGVRQASQPGRSYAEASLTWSNDGAWVVARGQVLELINVASGLTLPLGYTTSLIEPAWKP